MAGSLCSTRSSIPCPRGNMPKACGGDRTGSCRRLRWLRCNCLQRPAARFQRLTNSTEKGPECFRGDNRPLNLSSRAEPGQAAVIGRSGPEPGMANRSPSECSRRRRPRPDWSLLQTTRHLMPGKVLVRQLKSRPCMPRRHKLQRRQWKALAGNPNSFDRKLK